jgi:hypothetical protein
VLSISSGHRADYLTGAVAAGRENYYTGAVAAGEPPGRWSGRGAEALGLSGEVDSQDMTALYERFIDPRDEKFRDPAGWDEAETLGHTGRAYKTEEEIYAAALAKEPGADAERRAALRTEAGKKVRRNVAFHDATFSVQKSVTVLHTAFEAQEVQALDAVQAARGALAEAERTGDPALVHRSTQAVHRAQTEAASWGQYRQAVEDAIWAGNQAALSYLSDKAGYTRVGHHGGAAGRWADAHDWTVASFFQHDSRDHDPQLHIHNAILNRVRGADGEWRTIDGEVLHRYKPAAGAVGERVMEHHLAQALGVRFAMRPDGRAREVVGIDQAVMDLFSSRRKAITKKTAVLVREFESKFGRQPNSLELDRLQRTATFATRKAKSHDGETVAERLERWDAQLRAEVRGGLGKVAQTVLASTGRARPAETFNERKVLETALAEVQTKQAEWEAADLTREISNALPDDLGDRTPEQVAQLLDQLTDQGLRQAVPLAAQRPGEAELPDELRLADGTSAYQAPGGTRYATPEHLGAERQLARAGYARGAALMQPHDAAAFCKQVDGAGFTLGADQEAAVRGILSSGAKVEALIGPAGTGKSRVVGALAKAWEDPDLWGGQQRRMVGLAASQVATEVLAADGVTARNITRWLMTQQHIAAGSATREEFAWQLRDGDLVVVDESAMASTSDLAAIHSVCDEAGAKLLLVGDHRQLAAVGAAGGMELVASGALTHELTETRRFQQAWEGPASLRLRAGDQSVLSEYHKQGRILDGGTVERAERIAADAWLSDRLSGRHSLLIADTNEQAARMSAQVRAKLVEYRLVDDERCVPLGLQGTVAGEGDIVQARQNAWRLAGYQGNQQVPVNRQQYRVVAVLADGGLRVTPYTGTDAEASSVADMITLPPSYVAEHLTLGYAATVHSSQGLTVDTTHAVTTQKTSLYALYVAMSRGRVANTAHVVTQSIAPVAETGEVKAAAKRSPLAVLGAAFELDKPQISALQAQADAAAEAGRFRTPAELLADGIAVATAGRTQRWLDELTDQGRLSEQQRANLAAEDGAGTLATLLRQVELAGHDPRQVLADAIGKRSLHDARRLSYVIHDRITKTVRLDPVGDGHTAWLPQLDDPAWSAYLGNLAAEADERATALGEQLADDPAPWAIDALGEPPHEEQARDAWIARAAAVAAHRDLSGFDAGDTAIGRAPKPGQPELYASWRAAWNALGRPDLDRAEAEMSDGQLRVRVRAYDREQAWAPPAVTEELAGTRQHAEEQRRTAALRTAEADATDDTEATAQLREEAVQAKALAEALDARAADLEIAAQARAEWYAHTAATRDAADRAATELAARAIENTDEGPTADEWLAAHAEAIRHDDQHRDITAEHDLADAARQRDRDTAQALPAEVTSTEPLTREVVADDIDIDTADRHAVDSATASRAGQLDAVAPDDIRQATANEGRILESDTVRVPAPEETAEAVRRAQRALIEIQQRRDAEERHAADEAARDDELDRWHQEHTTANAAMDTSTTQHDDGPALGLDDH